MTSKQQPWVKSWLRSRGGLVLLAFLAIAAFFLITEHRAHVFGVLPFLLLLLMPVLHLFHHGGHGGGHADHAKGQGQHPEGEKEQGKP